MSEFGFYSGEELFSKQFEKKQPIIEGFLFEKDSVILAGKPKAGKSIFLFQLICALTSGEALFEQYRVYRRCKVLYVQLEGSIDDSQDRFIRMAQARDLDWSRIFLMYSPPLALNEEGYMRGFIKAVRDKMLGVDVVIIDPIYFAMKGSLTNDEAVRNFTGQLRILQDEFGCAIILTHHFRKSSRDKDGNILAMADDDIFGSVFFQAWITHQFLMDKDRTSGKRLLQCNTQRSGNIAEKLTLDLVEPEPLYFKCMDHFPTKGQCVLAFLEKHKGVPVKAAFVRENVKVPKSTLYRELNALVLEGKIKKAQDHNFEFTYTLV